MSSHTDLNGGEELLPGQVTLPDTDSRRHLKIIIRKEQTHIFRHFSKKKPYQELSKDLSFFLLLPLAASLRIPAHLYVLLILPLGAGRCVSPRDSDRQEVLSRCT